MVSMHIMLLPLVLAAPTAKRQLLPLQQSMNTVQVAENVFRVSSNDPSASYSSALIVLIPKQRTQVSDLGSLTQAINGLGKQMQGLTPGITAQGLPNQGNPIQGNQGITAQGLPNGQIVPNQAGMSPLVPAQSGMSTMPQMPITVPVNAANTTDQAAPQAKAATVARMAAQEAFDGASIASLD